MNNNNNENNNNGWWNQDVPKFENVLRLNSYGAIDAFLKRALDEKRTILNTSWGGTVVGLKKKELEDLFVKELGLTKTICWSAQDKYSTSYYVGEDTFFDFSHRIGNSHIVTLNEETHKKYVEICKQYYKKSTEVRGAVNMLVQVGNNISLSHIGVAGISLKEDNYTDTVVDQYKKVVKELKSKDPLGRITILSGDPGSGKTHLVKGLLNDCTNTCFVFIPSFMVSNLSAPQLVPVLAEQAEEGKPIVLVIEDADSCLVVRGADNMSQVSTLLNLGDGILGSILDIRIVCTTNAKKLTIDTAISRDGRLCQFIEVNKLPKEKANSLLKSLLNKEDVPEFTSDTSLATVYKTAKDLGYVNKIEESDKEEIETDDAVPVSDPGYYDD